MRKNLVSLVLGALSVLTMFAVVVCDRGAAFADGCSPDGAAQRCAGIAVPFHHDGAASAQGRVWAGRWRFTDAHGVQRQGSCVLNRGIHPSASVPAQQVPVHLALDPSARVASYLLWKYGNVTDGSTVAAMWAVLHHLAGDATGGGLGGDPSAPLVGSFAAFGHDTGRADLAQRAAALEAEGRRFTGVWKVSARFEQRSLLVSVSAGEVPVPRTRVTVLVSGSDSSLAALTGADGIARFVFDPTSGASVVASVTSPGPAEAFRGTPAVASAAGAQVLLTAGAPVELHASAMPTVATTTTPPSTATSTTAPATTDPVPVDTVDTVPVTTVASSDQLPPTTIAPPTTAPSTQLPVTGSRLDGGIALAATALLVGGVGVLGTLRRGQARGRSQV